jgi:hypothetical protein
LAPPQCTTAARDRAEQDIYNRLARRDKRPVVLEEGMELRDAGVSPREAQTLDVRRYVTERVASQFGVPLGMVGLADDVEDARALFLADTLTPLCQQLERALNHSILVGEYGLRDFCFEFNLDEKHMGEDRIKALTSASGRPVLLTNEARAMLNKPPVEGGDELVTPSNVVVGEKPSVDVMPVQDPNKPSQDGDHREEDAPLAGVSARIPPPVGPVARVRAVLDRCYERERASFRERGGELSVRRFTRELTDDLLTLAPGARRAVVSAKARGVQEALARALADADDPDAVFDRARETSSRLAAVLSLHLGVDVDGLRELGVPDEMIWEARGFTVEEVDRMRAAQVAAELSGGDQPG